MKIAIPVADGKLCAHFGHCQKFAIIEVDTDSRKIISKTDAEPPPHEPGILPQWLSEQGVNLIIAGGMGQRAQQFFNQYNIEVITGVTDVTSAEEVTMNYLNHTLQAGDNICDH
ncbi:MAG: ATPase [candidate division Zixibacteria bacterium 4484_95]|nr:MAG: ATPase [candidate division Zixibacteria bacterium 4484_95]RKX21127.1 MAG: ATPase [candidate division Zixibacteria bacterium]